MASGLESFEGLESAEGPGFGSFGHKDHNYKGIVLLQKVWEIRAGSLKAV